MSFRGFEELAEDQTPAKWNGTAKGTRKNKEGPWICTKCEAEFWKRTNKHGRCPGCLDKGKRGENFFQKYGLTNKLKYQKYVDQDGKCDCCGDEMDYEDVKIDHCHRENRLRGLVCNNCNTILGFAHDRVRRLRLAIEYLKRYKENPGPLIEELKKENRKFMTASIGRSGRPKKGRYKVRGKTSLKVVGRPRGRPRKYPVVVKPPRPRGRPRKLPGDPKSPYVRKKPYQKPK